MQRFKKHMRLVVALVCLTSAFLLSISFGDRGLQFDLRQSAGAASDVSANKDYNLSALRILNRVLLHLKDSYVEPERIHPSKMLVEALDEIQNSIAEVVITYDRKEESPKQVTVRVHEQSRTFLVEGIQSLWEMSFKLKEIFGFIQESLGPDTEVKYQEVEYAAINGMLKTLDPHSTLLPPRNYEEMQTQTGGKFGGLGIVISLRDGQLTVISPIDGTPA
ncbi:MAG: peptidase S41, partial [Myxococcota bacterium]